MPLVRCISILITSLNHRTAARAVPCPWESAALASSAGAPNPRRPGVPAPPGRRGQPTDPSWPARASGSACGPGSGRHEGVQMEGHSWQSSVHQAGQRLENAERGVTRDTEAREGVIVGDHGALEEGLAQRVVRLLEGRRAAANLLHGEVGNLLEQGRVRLAQHRVHQRRHYDDTCIAR